MAGRSGEVPSIVPPIASIPLTKISQREDNNTFTVPASSPASTPLPPPDYELNE